MLFVTFGLLFGMVILVWCFVLSVTRADSALSARTFRPRESVKLPAEEFDYCAEIVHQKERAA